MRHVRQEDGDVRAGTGQATYILRCESGAELCDHVLRRWVEALGLQAFARGFSSALGCKDYIDATGGRKASSVDSS